MFQYLIMFVILLILAIYFTFIKRNTKCVTSIDKKYVLITGCDSGFGRATAIRLDSLGFNVYATCLTKEGEISLRASCSGKLDVVQIDVTDSAQVQAAYEYVKKTINSDEALWAVINNAGISTMGPTDWEDVEDMKKIFDVNLWGTVIVTKTFLPLLKKSGGRLVNLSSIAGRLSMPNMGCYSMSKYGVEAFSDCLRRELQYWGINVVLIEPGYFITNMTMTLHDKVDKRWNRLPQEKKEEYGENFLNKVKANIENDLKTMAASNLDLVTDAILDGVMLVKPNYRYVVGSRVPNFLLIILTFLPTWFADTVLMHFSYNDIANPLRQDKKNK